MKNVDNFQIAKVQPRMFLNICLIFCQFQPAVAYKSVTYKKSVYIYICWKFWKVWPQFLKAFYKISMRHTKKTMFTIHHSWILWVRQNLSKKAINYKKGWWFKDASDNSRACLYKLKIIFVWLIWDHYHSFKMVNNVRRGVLLLVCFEGYYSVAGYQQHSLQNIAVLHRCFSLSSYSFPKFNTASRVFFTRSHLKHRFLKNFV